jgi:hypothetical protein
LESKLHFQSGSSRIGEKRLCIPELAEELIRVNRS